MPPLEKRPCIEKKVKNQKVKKLFLRGKLGCKSAKTTPRVLWTVEDGGWAVWRKYGVVLKLAKKKRRSGKDYTGRGRPPKGESAFRGAFERREQFKGWSRNGRAIVWKIKKRKIEVQKARHVGEYLRSGKIVGRTPQERVSKGEFLKQPAQKRMKKKNKLKGPKSGMLGAQDEGNSRGQNLPHLLEGIFGRQRRKPPL